MCVYNISCRMYQTPMPPTQRLTAEPLKLTEQTIARGN